MQHLALFDRMVNDSPLATQTVDGELTEVAITERIRLMREARRILPPNPKNSFEGSEFGIRVINVPASLRMPEIEEWTN